MRIGIPKEIKNHEYRVGVTPDGAREFVVAGHTVHVQAGAGAAVEVGRSVERVQEALGGV